MQAPRYDEGDDAPQLIDPRAEDAQAAAEAEARAAYRGTGGDPLFGLLLALAVAVGLAPLLPQQADLRYVLAWGTLAGVSILSWLLGNFDHIRSDTPENVLSGIGFGVFISAPFLLFFFDTFERSAALTFPQMGAGTALAFVVFVQALAETLFFRGLLQREWPLTTVALMATGWNALVFLPVMWRDVLAAPAVGIFLLVLYGVSNLTYGYVRQRNSLAAAWLCQIAAGVVLVGIPLLL